MTAPVILVTGTGTEVGKTVTTAALAAALLSQGLRVAVVKPAQTGLRAGEPGDVAEVARLADPGDGRLTTHEFVRLPDPLAPDAAARVAGMELPPVATHAARIAQLAADGSVDTVLVEGAGGLLVRLDGAGGTLADLAIVLREHGVRAGFVLVTTLGLGTLNATALTAEALRRRELDLIGYLIGSRPESLGLVERCNLEGLPRDADAQPLGSIPAGAASLGPHEFQAAATKWVQL